MKDEIVYTKTKYKVLEDAVYLSPVDQDEIRTRKVLGFVFITFLLLIALAVIT